MRRTDKILINDLSISVVLEDGARWPSSISRPQPLLLSLEIVHDCAHAALNDDLSLTVDYGLLCATLIAQFRDGMGNGKAFLSVEAFSDSVYDICFERFPEVQELSLMVKKPNALLCASCAKLQSSRLRIAGLHHERFIIEDLSCPVIAGVNACEREEEQIVRFTITLDRIRRSTVALDFRRLEAEVLKVRSIHRWCYQLPTTLLSRWPGALTTSLSKHYPPLSLVSSSNPSGKRPIP